MMMMIRLRAFRRISISDACDLMIMKHRY